MSPTTRRARRWRRRAGQRGQITVLLIALSVCLLLAVAAVTDVSAAYLRRQGALSLADSTALAATRAIDQSSIYRLPHRKFVPIDQHQALLSAQTFLRRSGAYHRYPGLRLRVRVAGHRVYVTLQMPYRLPITVPGVQATTQIHATSAAELPIYQ